MLKYPEKAFKKFFPFKIELDFLELLQLIYSVVTI